MNNKERVFASLNHRQPDKIPYNISFTQKAYQNMIEHFGERFEEQLDNCFTTLSTEKKNGWNEVEPDIWQDEFGVRWNRSIDKDIGVVCNCLITPENIYSYEFPDPEDPNRYEDFKSVIKKHNDKFVLAQIGFSLFERAWTLAGMENVLMAMIAEPSFIHDLLDRILDYNMKVIERACGYDIDGMLFGDDWGQQTGLIMGPQLWRKFIAPRVKKMYQYVKAKGKYVMIHSCGKVDEIFPDLIEAGLDVFNPFQPEVMNVFEIKKKYGDKLSFYGGISTQRILPYGTVEETKKEVCLLLDEVGRNGGYIAAPAHAIPGDAKPENIVAMIEVLNNQ